MHNEHGEGVHRSKARPVIHKLEGKRVQEKHKHRPKDELQTIAKKGKLKQQGVNTRIQKDIRHKTMFQ